MNAYCGVDCEKCPLLQASRVEGKERQRIQLEAQKSWSQVLTYEIKKEELICSGCKSDNKYLKCVNCDIERCCKERNHDNCSECEDYPCVRIIQFSKYISENEEYLFKDNW